MRGRISFSVSCSLIEPVLLNWCGGIGSVEASVQFRAEQDSVQVLLSLEF